MNRSDKFRQNVERRKHFGQNVKSIREENGLSQERLALMVGISRQYLSDVERGKRNVGIDNIVKISDALNVEPERLFRSL